MSHNIFSNISSSCFFVCLFCFLHNWWIRKTLQWSYVILIHFYFFLQYLSFCFKLKFDWFYLVFFLFCLLSCFCFQSICFRCQMISFVVVKSFWRRRNEKKKCFNFASDAQDNFASQPRVRKSWRMNEDGTDSIKPDHTCNNKLVNLVDCLY